MGNLSLFDEFFYEGWCTTPASDGIGQGSPVKQHPIHNLPDPVDLWKDGLFMCEDDRDAVCQL